jgi:hypothetical protein
MWPHALLLAQLWAGTVIAAVVSAASVLVIWDLTRTEPAPPGYDPLRSRAHDPWW